MKKKKKTFKYEGIVERKRIDDSKKEKKERYCYPIKELMCLDFRKVKKIMLSKSTSDIIL